MERRLIHFGHETPSETQDERLPSREAVRRNIEARLDRHASDAGVPLVKDAVYLAENKEALRMRVSKCFEDIPLHANAIAASYAQLLPPERQQAILEQVNAGESLREELGLIMNALTMPVEAENGAVEHRYVRGKETPEGSRPWYGIDFKKIESDQRLIASLKEANPDMTADLAVIANALGEYARPDPSLPTDRWGIIHANEGDKQILGMAKFVAIIVAGSAAVLTGALAIGRREGFTAPLLYAGVTGLLAAPGLRRSIFGSQNDRILAQVDATVNARDFKENVRLYDVAGPEWESFVDTVMHDLGDTKAFLKKLSRHPVDSPLNAETIDEYVNGAMPAGEGREQLRRMILDGRFPAFAERLMGATNDDVRDVVREYVGRGASRFEHLAERSADDAESLFHSTRKPYLGGRLNAQER